MLRYITSGESHGRALTGVLEGMPAGLTLGAEDIDRDLKRRQVGHGRGGRMKIESDSVQFLSGIRWGRTLGSPITLLIENRDWENWKDGMSPNAEHAGSLEPVTRPRPGHADLAGALKYAHRDIRNVLERSSARETAMRVALGAVCKKFLGEFGISFGSFITSIGSVGEMTFAMDEKGLRESFERAESSPVRCPDEAVSKKMTDLIDKAKKDGDSLGGVFTVFALGVPPGLGSYVQWDRRLEGRLAQAMMSIQAIKGVSVGLGFEAARKPGSEVMDEIEGTAPPFTRSGNNAGGIEGGMSNGMPIVLSVAMKPIPTLSKPLKSVDLMTKESVEAAYERSDVCAAPAAAVIGEAMAALVITDVFMDKFGGDSIEETKRNFESYMESVRNF
jgi:chorismate synthase